ncbi:Zinc finger, C2H2 [Kalmanozyma brasiliensis GHG001]|uniref:C2H2-type domain-containing protein n=1 Tax=Kalmanozyma brasiliensis (strain GHG001) TaxID=1365824 RepID=V5EY85_KALBG|nr:Zinc finger, C2H2 [Kalmanozyma brasiliensis GHG001]EST07629.1 Zinc finger, C2H2 [Kalmanozyma brasiliensis GHG001]
MSAFTSLSPGVTSYGSPPYQLDSSTKPFDASNPSDRIGELQKFLLGSDWSSLSSLRPSAAPVFAVADVPTSWPASMANLPLVSSSVETIKPSTMLNATTVDAPAAVDPAPAATSTSTTDSMSTSAAWMSTYPSPLTPPHRQSFDTCYSDSVGSPDSERDFHASPSTFDDLDFEFGAADTFAFPLFNDQSFEDPVESDVEDPVSVSASQLQSVKLEADQHDSQETETDFDASQSTVMPTQSQVKVEDDVYRSPSTLDAAFKTEVESAKFEPKDELDLWTAEDRKPYFSDDDDVKDVKPSTLAEAYAFGHDLSQAVKVPFSHDDLQKASQVGPMRPARSTRDRRASPVKAFIDSASASPAPFVDPVTNTKRWQCDACGKLFDRAYNLKTHRYTHEDPETRARPFVCFDADCQKQFARKHDMQRHYENVHCGESRSKRGGSVKRGRAGDMG